jgi:hypothetical protein
LEQHDHAHSAISDGEDEVAAADDGEGQERRESLPSSELVRP